MKQPEEKQDEALEELHDKYAPVMLDIILAMKGFYVKVGQIGSTRADFMPKQYLRSLEKLQVQSLLSYESSTMTHVPSGCPDASLY